MARAKKRETSTAKNAGLGRYLWECLRRRADRLLGSYVPGVILRERSISGLESGQRYARISDSARPARVLVSGSQTGDPRLAVHRTIAVVDVEGFGDHRRTNMHQAAVRDGLYRVMRKAFVCAGIPWDDCDLGDRGDGVLVLVPAEVPKGLLVESVPPALIAGLHEHNGAHPGPEQIRLRMALHAGEVCYDEHGVTAASINLAFRLLEADPLRAALARSPGVLALIVSPWFFEEVVRHSSVVAQYRLVEVTVKETTTTGWICLPDHADPEAGPLPQRP